MATLFILLFRPGRDTQGSASLPYGQIIASTFSAELHGLDVEFRDMGVLACDSVVVASYEVPDEASSFLGRLCANPGSTHGRILA